MREMIKEILDRTRRSETKLSRFIAGEQDAPTNTSTEVFNTDDGWNLEVNSMSVSLQAVISAARKAGCMGEEVLVCDNGKPRLIFREVK